MFLLCCKPHSISAIHYVNLWVFISLSIYFRSYLFLMFAYASCVILSGVTPHNTTASKRSFVCFRGPPHTTGATSKTTGSRSNKGGRFFTSNWNIGEFMIIARTEWAVTIKKKKWIYYTKRLRNWRIKNYVTWLLSNTRLYGWLTIWSSLSSKQQIMISLESLTVFEIKTMTL